MKKKWLTAFNHMKYGIYVSTVKCDDIFNGMIAPWNMMECMLANNDKRIIMESTLHLVKR